MAARNCLAAAGCWNAGFVPLTAVFQMPDIREEFFPHAPAEDDPGTSSPIPDPYASCTGTAVKRRPIIRIKIELCGIIM